MMDLIASQEPGGGIGPFVFVDLSYSALGSLRALNLAESCNDPPIKGSDQRFYYHL